jgi:hypothetical protein
MLDAVAAPNLSRAELIALHQIMGTQYQIMGTQYLSLCIRLTGRAK